MKTAIEMARECHIAAYIELSDPGSIAQELERALLSGEYDHYGMHKSALAMHTMRQAEIDAKNTDIAELVDVLEAESRYLASDVADAEGYAVHELRARKAAVDALITKHRPDAFAKWADGLIEG